MWPGIISNTFTMEISISKGISDNTALTDSTDVYSCVHVPDAQMNMTKPLGHGSHHF